MFSYVQAGSQVGYNFQGNNIASSVNAITLNYDGGVNIGNYLRILGKSIYNNIFNSSGFGHGTLTDFNRLAAAVCLHIAVALELVAGKMRALDDSEQDLWA